MHLPRNKIAKDTDRSFPWAYFDRTYLSGGECGGGEVLYLQENHSFNLHSGLGRRFNNYKKTLSLKPFLLFSIEKECRWIYIFGDSMVIINWFNNIQRCQMYILSPIL